MTKKKAKKKVAKKKTYCVEDTAWFKWLRDVMPGCSSGKAPPLAWIRKNNFRSLRAAWKACTNATWLEYVLCQALGKWPECEKEKSAKTGRMIYTKQALELRKAGYKGDRDQIEMLKSTRPLPPKLKMRS